VSGALQVSGGVGIGGNLYVGGEIVAQKLTIELTTVTTTQVITDDVIKTDNTTDSSSTTTGALIVAGGVGIGKQLRVGSSSTFGGSLIPNADGVHDLGSPTNRWATLYVSSGTIDIGGTTLSSTDGVFETSLIRVTGATSSTSTSTGALRIVGGLGVGQSANIGGNATVLGNVGIGTTSPSTLFNIRSSSPTIAIDDSGNGTSTISFRPSAASYAERAGLSVNYSTAELRLSVGVSGNTYVQTFYTNGNERARISAAGYLGVNNTNPSNPLTVSSTGNSVAPIGLVDTQASGRTWYINNGYPNVGNFSLYDGTAAAVRFVINTSGNVGIGKTDPSFKLDVDTSMRISAVDGSGGLQIGTATPSVYHYINFGGAVGGTDDAWQIGRSPTGGVGPTNGFYIYDIKSSATRFVINTSGNVGIGTTSPINNSGYGGLSLNGTSGALFSMMTNGTESSRIASLGDETSIQSKATTGYISFVQGVSGGTERMRLDANGNLGIGTSSPGVLLDIQSSSGAVIRAKATGDATQAALILDGYATTGTYRASRLDFRQNNVAKWSLILDYNQNDTNSLTFEQSGSIKAVLDASANFSLDGGGTFVVNNAKAYATKDSGGTSRWAMYMSGGVSPSSGDILFVGNPLNNALGFFTNNTERMRIAGGGAVGIGTTGPLYETDIAGSTGYDPTSDNATVLRVRSTTSRYPTFPGETSAIAITKSGEPYGWRLLSQYVADTYAGANFHIQNSLDITPTWGTKFFISSAGNVGIGVTDPVIKLQVHGPMNVPASNFKSVASFNSTDSQAANTGAGITLGGVYTGGTVTTFAQIAGVKENSTDNNFAGVLALYTRPNGDTLQERMRITSVGNVGIGTTSPSDRLQIDGSASSSVAFIGLNTTSASNAMRIMFRESGTSKGQVTWSVDNSALEFLNQDEGGYTVFYTTPTGGSLTERMRITDAGNVGVGTASPFGTTSNRTCFSVNGTNDVSLNVGSDGVQRAYLYGSASVGQVGTIGALPLVFAPNDTERMRITSDGDIGIAATSPEGKLDVVSSGVNGTQQSDWSSAGISYNSYGDVTITRRHGATKDSTYGYTGPIIDFRTTNQLNEWSAAQIMATVDPQSGNNHQGGLLFLTSSGGTTDPTGRRNMGAAPQVRMMIGHSGDIYMPGKLGVGVSSPATELEVAKTLGSDGWVRTVTRDANKASFIGVYRSGSTYSAGVFAHNAGLSAWDDLWINAHNDGSGGVSGGTSNKVIIAGNVGIGTASPSERLHVSGGTIRIDGTTDGIRIFKDGSNSIISQLYLANAVNNRAYNWQLNADGSGLDLWTYGGSSWERKYTFLATGNVGIGTASPNSKLTVNGVTNVGLGGKLSLIGLDINSGDTPTYIKITTTIPFASGSADFTVNIKGFVYGDAAACDLNICWHYYNSTFYNATATSSGSWAPTIRLSAENGFVAIVLSSPAYWPKIYVESMYSSAYSDQYSSGWSWSDADANGSPIVTVGYKSNFGNGIVGNSNGLGIGVNPSEKLHVNGNIKVATGGVLYVENPAGGRLGYLTTNATGTLLSAHNDAGEPLLLSAPAASAYMSFSTAGSERARITGSGDVGIGTTNPGSKLEVRFSSNSYVLTTNSGDNNTGIRFSNTGRDYGIFVDGGSGSSNPLRFYDFTAAAERARITSGGDFVVGPVGGNGSGVVKASDAAGTNQPGSNLLLKGGDGGGTGNSYVAIFTAPGGSSGSSPSASVERVRVTPAGNFLFGTTSDIAGNGAYGVFGNSSSAGANKWAAYFGTNSSSSGAAPNFGLTIGWNKSGGGGETNIVYGTGVGSTPALAFGSSDGTTYTERARITSGGYFKASNSGAYLNSTATYHEINQTANDNILFIRSTDANYSVDGVQLRFSRNTTNNTFYALSYYNDAAAAYKFRVADSGDVTNTNGTYGTISDQKMKTDIVDAGSQWSDIKSLRFRKFKMKDDPSGLVQLGVVAQEVELTSPGLVDEHQDRDAEGNDLGTTTKSVKTSVLLMKAAKALQEAITRIESLEEKVNLLEEKLKKYE
jgi:hypothetical protein